VLKNVPKIREEMDRLMEYTAVKNEKLMVLLADVKERSWRRELIDEEMNE
jgi:hypothetical protein